MNVSNLVTRLSLVLVLIGAVIAPTQARQTTDAAAQQMEVFSGIARAEGGEVLYVEKHRVFFENGRHKRNDTRYSDPSGSEFAVLSSRFTSHPYVPNYQFEDKRFGRENGTSVSGDFVKVHGKKSASSSRQESWLELADNMIAGQGLHFFIRDHLEELAFSESGKKVEFLIPLEGKKYGFQIRRINRPDEKSGTVTLKIESDNWLFRLFAPSLEVQYELDTKRLLSYRGASNLLDGNKAVQTVKITYQYAD